MLENYTNNGRDANIVKQRIVMDTLNGIRKYKPNSLKKGNGKKAPEQGDYDKEKAQKAAMSLNTHLKNTEREEDCIPEKLIVEFYTSLHREEFGW